MTQDSRAIAALLDEVVRGVPGVATLFAADPALLRSARQLTAFADTVPLVAVSESADVLTIAVNIGVDDDEQAPMTAASVAVAIRAALPGREVEVAVRVSRAVR